MFHPEDTAKMPAWFVVEDLRDFVDDDVVNALKALALLLDTYGLANSGEPTFPFHRGIAHLLWVLTESIQRKTQKISS